MFWTRGRYPTPPPDYDYGGEIASTGIERYLFYPGRYTCAFLQESSIKLSANDNSFTNARLAA